MEQKAQASRYRCQVTPLLRLFIEHGRSDQCQGKNSTEVIKVLVKSGAFLSIPATEVESSSIMYRFACFFLKQKRTKDLHIILKAYFA